jgi:hypothetical protein
MPRNSESSEVLVSVLIGLAMVIGGILVLLKVRGG